jgi:hypothetical protein
LFLQRFEATRFGSKIPLLADLTSSQRRSTQTGGQPLTSTRSMDAVGAVSRRFMNNAG